MHTIWTLIQTCIVPIITYASETWHPNKQETKKLNQLLDKILRRILMTPDATPREALYIETGLLDIATTANSKRLNMKARLNREKSDLMTTVLSNHDCMWEKDTATVMEKYGITGIDLEGSKYQTKALIKRAVNNTFKTSIEQATQGKSKMTYFLEEKKDWHPNKGAKYMKELTRMQTSLIFKARTRMIKAKGNYKNGHPDLTCRLCRKETETQKHILEECISMHDNDASKVLKHQLFNEDTDTLRQVAKNLKKITEKLGEVVY